MFPRLAGSLAGSRPLEQEQQSGLGVRRLVSQPVAAPQPFQYNGGGYATLSFIPTLATMILGLIAGGGFEAGVAALGQVVWLVVAGAIGLALGWGLGELGICPVVKRIWTPSWVLFSGGICLLLLAFFYAVSDLVWRLLLGVSPASHRGQLDHSLLPRPPGRGVHRDSLKTHLGQNIFNIFGGRPTNPWSRAGPSSWFSG